jgi:magnesium-transporting ATPase (P-type)
METNFRLEDGGEDRLWDYIDGMSSPEEKTAIEKLLESNAEWRAKYRELLEVNQLMQSTELEEPSMSFTKNVMEEIARSQIAPATRTYINKNIIRGIAACFIVLILGFLIYGFGQVTVETGQTGENTYIPDLNKIDFSKFFNNTYMNILLMINVILGLFLLDRYFAGKRQKYKKG